MKRSFYYCAAICFTVFFLACGSDKKQEKTGSPVEGEDMIDFDQPVEVFYELVHNKLEVVLESVGMTNDTAAASISGYIDGRNAPVPVSEMQLILQTRYKNNGKEIEQTDTLSIEEDGRIPGKWIAPNSACYFTLMAKDSFRFSTSVNMALYRLKLRFKAKA